MGQQYIWNNDGTVDITDGNRIWRSDGTVDITDGNRIWRSDGTVDIIYGNRIWRSDGTVDIIDGNRIWRSNGTVDRIYGNIENTDSFNGNLHNNKEQVEQQWSRTITTRHDNYNTGDERKKTITIIVSMLLVFVIATLVIISHKIDNQKNTYYTVYQATQDCEVLEPIKFTIGAYHVCHVSRGDYIFSITSKSGRSYYFFEKNSELIKVKVDNDVACTFRCYGTITEFDYKYTDWEKRFS